MKCVKTGLDFKDSETGKVHTGDLFVSDGEFFIRGIPSDEDGHPADFGADWPHGAVVYVSGGYDRREGRCDSHWAVEIEQITPEFRAFIAEWSPALLSIMPAEETANA